MNAPSRARGTPLKTPAWPGIRTWRLLLLTLALGVVVAAFMTGFAELAQQIRPPRRGTPPPPLRRFMLELSPWLTWGLLAPLVLGIAARLPLADGGWKRAIPLHLIGATAIHMAHTLLFTIAALPLLPLPQNVQLMHVLTGRWLGLWSRSVGVYLIVATIYYAGSYSAAYMERRREAARLRQLLAETRLHALQMQLHPHFLFNTLNAVSSLMENNVRQARRMIAMLSDLLRVALDENAGQLVPLEEEVRILERYVEIQRIRFGDRLSVAIDVPAAARRILVPRLLLQPLVENAIGHGLAPRAGHGSVRVVAERVGERLRIIVEDDGVGLPPGPLVEGVGLSNTRARLEHLHGDEHRLELMRGGDGGTVALLEMPAREEHQLRLEVPE